MRKKISLAKTALKRRIQPRVAVARSRIKTGHVGVVFRTLGPEAGIKAFWHTPVGSRNWIDIEKRMGWIARTHPDHLADFVAMAIAQSSDAATLIGLAQSTISDVHVRPLLAQVDGAPPTALQGRLKQSQVLSAAYVGAQMLLEGAEAGRSADRYARNLHRLPRWNYDRFLDSVSYRPHVDHATHSFESGYCTPKAHRLLILENARTLSDYKHLLRDARHVTIIDLTDIYGRTNFEDVTERGVESIQIEHIRTRITRFSLAYQTLHHETKAASAHVMAHLADLQSAQNTLFGDSTTHLTLDVADTIFFEALKVRALATLLADQSFDHIVVAHQNRSNQPFDRLLSCQPTLRSDPRVEFVSIARTMKQRLAARQTIITATRAPEQFKNQIPPLAVTDIRQDLVRKVQARVDGIDPLPTDNRDRLMMITGNNGAYNPSTASTLRALSDDYQITSTFIGRSLNQFMRSPDAADAMNNVTPMTVSHHLLPDLSDLSRWLQYHMQDAVQACEQSDIRDVATAFTGHIVRSSLLPGVASYAFMTGWFEKLQRNDQLPKLAIVTPQRNPKLGMLSEAARAFGVPSLALEPHGLNGNYCRYAKVAMDYYGVISDYFRDSAESDFGISKTRTRVIGSPRIIAPTDYDPTNAQTEARTTLEDVQPITFAPDRCYGSVFCQPSEWTHTAKVWRNIINATDDMNVTLMLKTHPEESKARVARYLKIAKELSAADRVIEVDGDPSTIIAASDFVLTGYSAAAIDAAVLQKPILCVTADHVPYPVDQHTIVHTKLCGDAGSLRTELTTLLNDPVENTKRTQAFLKAEPQFVSGPDAHLRDFVADILKTPPDIALRTSEQRPASLFLDGPFPAFNV